MKKIILSALGLSMFLSVCAVGATDSSGHWADDYISQAESENWIDMREDGSFSPDMYASRQEVAYMVYMSQKDNLDMTKRIAVTNFSDSQLIGEKYVTAVEVLAGNGIINGYEDGTFRPSSNITRAELTVMISSFISDSKPFTTAHFGYNDETDIPQWAKTYITRCSKAGLIRGYSDNTFRAKNNVTRAEAVTMIVNLENFNYVEPLTETTTSDTYKVIRQEKTETTTAKGTKVVKTINSGLDKTNQTTEDTRIKQGTSSNTVTETSTETTTSDINVEYDKQRAEDLAQEINNKRIEATVNTLELDDRLCRIATLKAQDMYKTGCLEDNSDTYGGVEEMLGKFNVKYIRADQTFASGVERASDVIAIFENDPVEYEMYIKNGYEQMGIGYYNGYWSIIYKE
jgi:uncharacterized protein YkwD